MKTTTTVANRRNKTVLMPTQNQVCLSKNLPRQPQQQVVRSRALHDPKRPRGGHPVAIRAMPPDGATTSHNGNDCVGSEDTDISNVASVG